MYKKIDKDLKLIYSQDNYITIVPIELDGFRPNPLDLNYEGYIYKPFDEIERYVETLTFNGNIAKIPFNTSRAFEYIYRYNIYVTVTVGGISNKYVIQNGNIEFEYEHRIPDES